MGTKTGPKVKTAGWKVRFLTNQGGPVAQVLHSWEMKRDNPNQIAELLLQVEDLLNAEAPNVRLVLTGGGLLEVQLNGQLGCQYLKTQEALEWLLPQCREVADRLLSSLRHTARDYLFGIDFLSENYGVGQFGVLARKGRLYTIAWKSYPVGSEGNILAGFGTDMGRRSPRVVDTQVGRAMILVCHDAQAFNHRNKALVRRAHRETLRSAVMSEMACQMEKEQPA